MANVVDIIIRADAATAERILASVQGRVGGIGGSARASSREIAGFANSVAGGAGQMLGFVKTLALAVAGYAAFNQTTRATATFIRSAFASVEQFRAGIASTAATLTSFAASKTAETFAQNLEFAAFAMEKLQLMAARFVAEGKDLQIVFQTFATRGIVPVSERDFEAMGRITDAVLAVTAGQNKEVQLRQEIRALMEGHVRANSILSQIIEAQVGDLDEWVVQHKAAGDLLPAIAEQLKGFALAEKTIQELASTWYNTLQTIFSLISRRAFTSTFDYIVLQMKRLSDFLLDADGNLTKVGETTVNQLRPAFFELGKAIEGITTMIIDNWDGITKGIEVAIRAASNFFKVMNEIGVAVTYVLGLFTSQKQLAEIREQIELVEKELAKGETAFDKFWTAIGGKDRAQQMRDQLARLREEELRLIREISGGVEEAPRAGAGRAPKPGKISVIPDADEEEKRRKAAQKVQDEAEKDANRAMSEFWANQEKEALENYQARIAQREKFQAEQHQLDQEDLADLSRFYTDQERQARDNYLARQKQREEFEQKERERLRSLGEFNVQIAENIAETNRDSAVQFLNDWLDSLDSTKEGWDDLARAVNKAIDEIVRKPKEKVRTWVDDVSDILKSGFNQAWEDVLSGAKNFGESLMDALGDIARQLQQMLTNWIVLRLVEFITGAKIPGMATGGIVSPGHIASPVIPIAAAAVGNVFTGPTMVMAGEGKNAEAFVPLPDNRSIPVTLNDRGREIKITNVVVFDRSQIPRTSPDEIISVVVADAKEGGPVRQVIRAYV